MPSRSPRCSRETHRRLDMGKAILLTGAPGVGKSTLCSALAKRIAGLQVFDYGRLLLEQKARQGRNLTYPKLRKQSAQVISPRDVSGIDDITIERVNALRDTCDIVLDSHALTAEAYGLRAIPYSTTQLQSLSLDAVIALRCDPSRLIRRTRSKPRGRRRLSAELMRELQTLQESAGIMYAVACGCPIFIIDTTRRAPKDVLEIALRNLSTVGLDTGQAPRR